MPDRPVRIEVNETGNADARLNKLLGTLKKAAVAIGAIAVAAKAFDVLKDAIGGAVDEAAAAELVMADLDAAIQSGGWAATDMKASILGTADALSKLTRTDDEAIIGVETLLLDFKTIGGDIMPAATEAVLDFATRMKVDVDTAARLVGKSLAGNADSISVLTRYGIVFTDQLKDQYTQLLETGQQEKAQMLILKELQKTFGGAARAAGETFTGQLDVLDTALGNVKEAAGTPLLTPLTAVVGKLIEFATRKDIIQAATDFGSALANIAEKGAGPLIAGLEGVVNLGAGAMRTISDIVDVLSGTYQQNILPPWLGQDVEIDFAQRLSDAIRSGDWSGVGVAIQEKGAELGAKMLEGIKQGLFNIPNAISISLDLADTWVHSDAGSAKIRGVGYAIADILYASTGRKPAVGGAGDPIWQWIVNADASVTAWKDDIKQLGIDIAALLLGGVSDWLNSMFWQTVLDAIRGGKKDEELTSEGTDAGKTYADGVQTGLLSKEVYLPVILKSNPLPYYGGQAPGMAQGGMFVVPPGYPNDTFPALFTSGEVVKVWPHNQVVGFAGGTNPPWFDNPDTSGGGNSNSGGGGSTWPGLSYDPEDAFDAGVGIGETIAAGTNAGYRDHMTTWLSNWPQALLHASSAGFQSVGIAWIDDILVGMGGQQDLSPEIKGTLEGTFKKWWGALKDTFGDPGSGVRRNFQDWMDAWMGIATTTAGESMGSIAQRMLDSALAMGGPGVAAIVEANSDLFVQIMGETADDVVGGAYDAVDKLIGLAGSLGGLGSAAAERYRAAKIAPEQERLALLEQELATLEAQDATHYEIAVKAREIEEQKALIAEREEKILALQQAQSDLSWIQAQLDMIKTATDAGIDLGALVPGMQWGLGADPEQILATMTALMAQLVQSASASFPTYASGTSYVPRTGLAMLHQGESVVPAGARAPVTVIIEWKPTVSLESEYEAQYKLGPYVEATLRDRGLI